VSITTTLRDYQEKAVSDLRSAIAELKAAGLPPWVLLVSETGSGKGTIASHMIESAVARQKRVGFLVNRCELVKDLSKRLDRLGVDHGVIMGNHPRRRPWLRVQVASIDTLHRFTKPIPFDLIFADEAHFSISPTWLKVLNQYPGTPVIGMTATPIRADGRGLGEFFKQMIRPRDSDGQVVGMREFIEMGYLVPTRVFAPSMPDLSSVKVTAGEYNQKQLAQVVDRSTLTGDIVDHWMRLAHDRPTVCFAVNIEHSRHIVERFRAAGVRAEHVDGKTSDEERDRCWAGLEDGSVQLVSSVGVISYGWDCPVVSCAIMARPSKSLALYLQMIGRVLRPHPGKHEAIILDHAGLTLEGVKKRRRGPRDNEKERVYTCEQCWFTFDPQLLACPNCQTQIPKRDITPEVVPGELQEVVDRVGYGIKKLSKNPRVAALQIEAAEKGYRPGWVWNEARRRGYFGHQRRASA
jgi:DNA repair protein RadD